jgi:hypothetical protein
MKKSFKCCALIALLLVIKTDCVLVQDNDGQNVTTVEPTSASVRLTDSSNSTNSSKLQSESLKLENRQINSDESMEYLVTTSSSIYKIPPTLLNTRIEQHSEKPGMSLKDFA